MSTNAAFESEAQSDDFRRRLTHDECIELLMRPLVGVFSSLTRAGWIHSVPVHFLYRDGEIRILCGSNSVKARNADRTGRGTLCVEVAEHDRRFVSVEGRVHIERPASAHDAADLDLRYSRSDSAEWTDDEFMAEVVLVLRPVRWIAWADWD